MRRGDFFENPENESNTIRKDTLDRIFNFLDISDHRYDLFTSFKKTNPNNLRDMIENYDEIKNLLKGSKFEYFLN